MAILVRTPLTLIKVVKPDKVVVVRTEHRIVKIKQGPPGPRGPAGSTTGTYEIVQSSPSTTWTIVHNLGKRPAGWTIYDTADTIYEAGAVHINDNVMQFTFSAAISGRVVLV